MRILISNDDGIRAAGIEALVKALHGEHTVVVAAPAEQQSAKAHAITVRSRLYVEEYLSFKEKYGVKALSITGTPADTVKLYLEGILHSDAAAMPDLVISGINDGSNLGTDVLYSGTVGAATEGFVHNINSLAVSLEYNAAYSFDFVAEEIKAKLPQLFPADEPVRLLNVNFPRKFADKPKWIWSRQGIRDYCNAYKADYDEEGRLYYTVGGDPLDDDVTGGTDVAVALRGHISVTPLMLDKTNFACLHVGEEL